MSNLSDGRNERAFYRNSLAAKVIKITDDCINCGGCKPKCPNNAIYEGTDDWRYKDCTTLKGGVILLLDGKM